MAAPTAGQSDSDRNKETLEAASSPGKAEEELTVCEIMGEWGLYQWSLTLFATLYSAICAITVVVGPLWTPDMKHICLGSKTNESTSLSMSTDASIVYDQTNSFNFQGNPHECYLGSFSLLEGFKESHQSECTTFFYDDSEHGIMLTNSFDLVCSREYLRSAISSSALLGMFLSSVTLGLVSDKFGRMSCVHLGTVISLASTILAILSHNYLLLNISIMLMSYAQIGVGNALCTLVMEATSPKYRFVPCFEFGFGWGLGILIAPFLNDMTHNYKHFLLIFLAWQLLMVIWMRFGVFESIRWLLSEGNINQAQIELRRACRFNRVQNGADLAQKIADVQMDQLRKASHVISKPTAPARLAKATQQEIEAASQEVGILKNSIRKSFSIESGKLVAVGNNEANLAGIEIDLGREQFLEANSKHSSGRQLSLTVFDDPHSNRRDIMDMLGATPGQRFSITTQGLVQLALKYSKTVQEQEEGKFFLVQMFHRKLYKITLILMLLSVMLETTYYGLIQANKFVGGDINSNYISGALSEWVAAGAYIFLLVVFNRRVALVLPTLLASLCCVSIAEMYRLIPNQNSPENVELGLTGSNFTFDKISFMGPLIGFNQTGDYYPVTQTNMLEYRESLNFYIMILGKLTITSAIQVSATMVMEAYPNNLRATGSGTIVMIGRIGSVLAPFLFNDSSEDKLMFRCTMLFMAATGVIVSLLVPLFVRDTTGMELADRLNDIEDDD